jgi:hypothetical protein
MYMLAVGTASAVRLEIMKVRELMRLLAVQDPEAEISLVNQPHYPMEHRISGVVARGDLIDGIGVAWRQDEGVAPADVLIVEGAWQRYGVQSAWSIADSSARPTKRVTTRRK